MATVPTSAKAIVDSFLAQFGLQSLGDWAWNQYKNLGGGDVALQQINTEMVNRPEFKARFPAAEALAKQGRAMSPAQMLAYEDAVRQQMRAAGLPKGFYDQPADFAKFMVADVSPTELSDRIQTAQAAVYQSDANVRNELQRLYGIDAGHLTAHFLDPNVAAPILQRQFNAAQVAGAADRTHFGQINAATAEQLAIQGVSADQAQQGFGQLGEQAGLFQSQVQGENQIGQQTQIAAQFSNDAAARERIKRRQEARKADFGGRSGFGVGQQGVSALGTSDTTF